MTDDYDKLAQTVCDLALQLWNEGGHNFRHPGDAIDAAIHDLTYEDDDVDEARLREAIDECTHPLAGVDWDAVVRGQQILDDWLGSDENARD
jgi:hypothetical protein